MDIWIYYMHNEKSMLGFSWMFTHSVVPCSARCGHRAGGTHGALHGLV